MKTKTILLYFIFSINLTLNAQSDFSSPYSIYGIGKENLIFFGGFSAMGNSGIAYRSSSTTINKSNPSSLTTIKKNSFLYELGFNNTYSLKFDSDVSQKENNFNFTHLAMAFPINKYWNMSIGIQPYSKVNYEIDIIQPIEGSINNYKTKIIGSGGINEIFWGHGFKINNNLSFGTEFVGLFGSISQEQWLNYGLSSTYLNDKNVYFSLGATLGVQYTLGSKTTFGATINFPTILRGAEATVGTKSSRIISSEFNQNADDFNLPLKLGFGISSQLNKKFLINVDYRIKYWENTNQTNNASTYINQSIYAIGIEFKSPSNHTSYFGRIKYRAGINYDSGYLNINNKNINRYSFSLGLGLPTSKSNFSSFINLNYSYGKEGTTDRGLIQENFHKLSLNLSMFGNWFQKPKIF